MSKPLDITRKMPCGATVRVHTKGNEYEELDKGYFFVTISNRGGSSFVHEVDENQNHVRITIGRRTIPALKRLIAKVEDSYANPA